MLERQLRKVEGTLTTAEYQLETLQSAVSNTVMYANMKYVARTLKAAQHHLPIDIDDIHDTVATIRGQKAIHDELLDTIHVAHSMAFGQEELEDEEELLRLLEVSLPNTSVTEALSNNSVADCDIHSPHTIPIKEMEASSQGNSFTAPVLTYCCNKLLPEVPVIADKLPKVPVPVTADKLPEILDKLPEVPVTAEKLPEVPVIADKLPDVPTTDRTNSKVQNKKSSKPKETAV